MSKWQIDPAHSTLEFAVKHLMIATVKGRFPDFKAELELDDARPSDSKLDVEVEVGSIDTHQPQRDAHLRSADFFDAEHHPQLSFKSRRVDGAIDGDFRIVGDLTIRGVTREVALDASFEGAVKDPWGNDRRVFTARGKLDRRDYGLVWNQLLETGGIAVSDEVKIAIDAEFTKKAA